jgi:hypothetical protein
MNLRLLFKFTCGVLCVTIVHAAQFAQAEEQADHGELEEAAITEFDRSHWSFHPLRDVAVPQPEEDRWVANPIDAFILSRLRSEGLTPQPAADRQTLIRRLSFDLTGLPPTPQQIDDFVADPSDDAYEKLVERLLNSEGYGERWAQHWLDLARFAETDGFEHDKLRPNAWKYRDWVIESLNSDLPYDQFIRLQIAGDEINPNDPTAEIATHFCLSGPDMPDINSQDERRHTLLNELTSTVGSVVLGLQLGCAQCHDHKFDPISQADFYRMRAFFEPAVHVTKNKSISTLADRPPFDSVSYVMLRGDHRRPGPKVRPDFLRIASSPDSHFVRPADQKESSGRRTALADWLTGKDNPLTARVIVNRVWQHHFGTGLCESPSDFGLMGVEPDHYDLLDWLAGWFVENKWSLKRLHHLIVTSSSYRQPSRLAGDADQAEREQWGLSIQTDPDARLLSRYPRWRLEGEAVRDAMLMSAGVLNRRMGGPGVRPPLPQELVETLLKNQWNVTKDESEHWRRSIYVFARRNLRYPIFEVFDRPDANVSCPERGVSTTAPQSLHLLNSEFSLLAAGKLASAVQQETSDPAVQVKSVFRRTLGRPPTHQEVTDSLKFLDQQAAESGESSPLTHLCLVVFNLNEFVVID